MCPAVATGLELSNAAWGAMARPPEKKRVSARGLRPNAGARVSLTTKVDPSRERWNRGGRSCSMGHRFNPGELMRVRNKLIIPILFAAAFVANCGGGSKKGESCTGSDFQQCTCASGMSGVQQCVNGTFAACSCGAMGTCGNNVLDPGEMCDGVNIGVETCASATMNAMPTGTLRCAPVTCMFDTSMCSGGAGTGGTGAMGGI